ncbi:MAG: outer membrane lipoprotein carrier protein LolA [Deltaproteobacteria bacterium]|nr:outer membrane lipoprotein carrier protein LolA [Deltaproteobacteria bacterium]
MKLRLIFIFAIAAALLPHLAFCGENTPINAAMISAKVQTAYQGIESLSANFAQETTPQITGKKNVERGEVFLQPPLNMRWEYTEPEKKVMIIDNQISWFYLPEKKVAYRQTSESLFASQTLIAIFRGTTTINTDFEVSLVATSPKYHTLHLVPLNDIGTKEIVLKIDSQTFLITYCAFEDFYGNHNAITFTNIALNGEMNAGLFQFRPPAGVHLIDINEK